MYGNDNYGGFLDHWHRAVGMSKGENKIVFKLHVRSHMPHSQKLSIERERKKMIVCEQAEIKLKYKFHNGTKTKMILHNL